MSKSLYSNKQIMQLIIPLVFEQLLLILVGMVDSIMVASVSEAAVSGVSLVDNIVVLVIGVFGALATGGAIVAGQYLGNRERVRASQSANQLVRFLAVLGILIMLLLMVLKNLILDHVFGDLTQEVHTYANTYWQVIVVSVPFVALYNGGAAIFRTMGMSRVTMKVSFMMNAINVVGNAWLIYGLGMGVKGAAISSLVSRGVAAVVILGLLVSDELELSLERVLSFRLQAPMIKQILRVGLPNGLESGMFQLGKVFLLSMIAYFGTASIAANAIGSVLAGLQVLPGIAISIAATTIIAPCVGAGDYESARYYTKKLLGIAYIFTLVTSLSLYLALPPIFNWYHLSPETGLLTKNLMTIHTFSSIILWPIAFVLPVTFRAAGDVKVPMTISILSMWTFRLILGYLLGRHLGYGVIGIWLAMVIDWTFRAGLYINRYRLGSWTTKRLVD